MSLLGPDRLLVGRSVVDRKEARCIHCMQPIKFGPKGEPGVVHSREGMKEMGISGMCETCFDNLSGEPDDWTFLEFKRSADEDEPCPCAGGTATCRGNCPIFDKVAKQDAAQPSQAPVVQAVQPEYCTACDMTSNDKQRCEDCPRRASSGATTRAVRKLTEPEIKALTAMVWGAPCSGRDLAIVTSTVRAMEALGPGERPIDPADGGRLLDVDACIVEPAPASQPQQEQSK